MPISSPPMPTRLPTLRHDLSRLSARNLRRPSPLPHGPLHFNGYFARLRWLFTGSEF